MKRVLVLLVMTSSLLFGNVGQENEIKTREIFSMEIQNITREHQLNLKEIENKYQEKERELNKKLDEVINEKEQIKLEKENIECRFNFLFWLFNIVGITSILGIIGVIIESVKIWKNIDKKVKERVDNEVSTIVNIEKKKIKEIVKKYDVEEKLKVTKEICILSVDNENKGNITKILKGFKKLTYEDIRDDIDFYNYDLILINHNAEYDMDKINNIIIENSNSYFFYYGSGRANSSKKNINFCNSIFTLYGNLINILRTQDLLSR